MTECIHEYGVRYDYVQFGESGLRFITDPKNERPTTYYNTFLFCPKCGIELATIEKGQGS